MVAARIDKAGKQIGGNVMGVQGDVSNTADLDRLYEKRKSNLQITVQVLMFSLGLSSKIHAEKWELTEHWTI